MIERWRAPVGTREMAPARACLRTDVPNQGVVLLVTSDLRAVTNVPRVYLVPSATNDPRVATRGMRAVAVSVTRGPNPAAIITLDTGVTKVCTR